MVESVIFYILAALLLGLGVLVIAHTNPLASALALVFSFACLAALYALLNAPLVAVLQVLVYAGGIMVLMVFVIMLLNLRREDLKPLAARPLVLLAALAFALLGVGAPLWTRALTGPLWVAAPLPEGFGGIHRVADLLFGPFIFPFEMLSLVLLAALVGALVLSKRRL